MYKYELLIKIHKISIIIINIIKNLIIIIHLIIIIDINMNM